MRLLAIDPSITCSGWALFEVKSERILGIGKIKPLSPRHTLAERLTELSHQVKAMFLQVKLSAGDLLICESPTSIKDPSAAFKVEQVRCLFENLARENGALVPGRINPRSVHFEILGLKGKQLPRTLIKDLAAGIVQRTHIQNLQAIGFDCSIGNLKKHQDIVDAILIGSLAITRVKSAQSANTPVDIYLQSLEAKSQRRNLKYASCSV